MRQEFMQWRIERSYGNGSTPHRSEDVSKILFLHRQEFCKSATTPGFIICKDHFPYSIYAVAAEKHMLGAAQPDAFRPERKRSFTLIRLIGIGTNVQLAVV